MDSSGLWLAGRINVYKMRFSRGEINDYYSIYTMTTSPYLYITTVYSYWRTSSCLNKLYNIQLQYFRAKFFYIMQFLRHCTCTRRGSTLNKVYDGICYIAKRTGFKVYLGIYIAHQLLRNISMWWDSYDENHTDKTFAPDISICEIWLLWYGRQITDTFSSNKELTFRLQ